MFTINWKLALIVLVLLPILFVIAVEFRKRILSEYRRVRKMNSKIVGSFNENITGVRVIKALGREKTNLAEFKTITDGMYQSSYRAAWWSALFLPTVQIVSAMAVGATVWYGGFQAQMGSMTIGDIQAFVSYITFMIASIRLAASREAPLCGIGPAKKTPIPGRCENASYNAVPMGVTTDGRKMKMPHRP